jgi:hypothetical protein
MSRLVGAPAALMHGAKQARTEPEDALAAEAMLARTVTMDSRLRGNERRKTTTTDLVPAMRLHPSFSVGWAKAQRAVPTLCFPQGFNRVGFASLGTTLRNQEGSGTPTGAG